MLSFTIFINFIFKIRRNQLSMSDLFGSVTARYGDGMNELFGLSVIKASFEHFKPLSESY